MDVPLDLIALNITPQGALLRWTPPLANVDVYIITLTYNKGMWSHIFLAVVR